MAKAGWTLDWVGYAVGQPPPPTPGGTKGFLDFVGYRTGASSGAVITPWRTIMGVGLSLLFAILQG